MVLEILYGNNSDWKAEWMKALVRLSWKFDEGGRGIYSSTTKAPVRFEKRS